MEILQSSTLYRLLAPHWARLSGNYEGSRLSVLIRWLAAALVRAWSGSVIAGFLRRDGLLSRAWKDSLVCRGLTALCNLPVRLFQWIYQKGRDVLEDSVAARLGMAAVEQTPVMVGWIMLGIMVIPYEHWNNAYSFGGFVLCLLMAVLAGMRKPDYRLDFAAVGPYLVVFAAAVCLAWPLSAYSDLSGRFLPYHLTCMLCVLVLVSTLESWEQLTRLLGMTSVALSVMSLFAFWQRIQGVEVNPSYVDLNLNKGMPGRVFAFYENPNAFGEVLLLLIPLSVALMLSARGWGGRLLGLLSAALGCMAIAMTYSRAGWVGLVIAACLFVLLGNRKLIPAGILVGCLGLAFLPDTVFHRILTIFNTSDSSTTSRFPLYQAAAEFLKLRPIQGAGLGSDAVRQAVKDLNLFHGKDIFVHCHNVYLQVWCETGLVGLIAFVGGIFWTLKQGGRAVSQRGCSPQTRFAVIGAVSALAGAMVCGIADYLWNYPRVMLIFWFVCAVALAGTRLAARESQNLALASGEKEAADESGE